LNLNKVIVVLLEHKPHFSLRELGQSLLHIGRHLPAVLAMAVCNCEEMAVFEATEVGHGDPGILVGLVRVRKGLASLRGEGELGHAVRIHLFWVSCIERVRL